MGPPVHHTAAIPAGLFSSPPLAVEPGGGHLHTGISHRGYIMRKTILAVAVLGGILAGCSRDTDQAKQADLRVAQSFDPSSQGAMNLSAARQASAIASLPDRGSLVAYDRTQAPVRHGAYTWHPAQLSEAYALRAIADGSMRVTGPAGQPIELQYERHIEHPDGNWTWVGRVAGAGKGAEAMLTFGRDAVFGTIANGNGEPLQVTTSSGRTWVVETDQHLLGAQTTTVDSDFLVQGPSLAAAHALVAKSVAAVPSMSASRATVAGAASQQDAEASALTMVDLVVGYTIGFATRLGGQSQALTRLNSMVDVANQAYVNSAVAAQMRLVRAVQVNYADNTSNRAALFELSGARCVTATGTGSLHLPDGEVSCTPIAVPAALQPLLTAREQSHADLVTLVRAFQSPENQSCGVAWLLGGGQHAIDANSARFGLSVVSDSSGLTYPDPDNGATCRTETLAHELGHNMGLAHDRVHAAGSDDTNSDSNLLDPEEYGRFAYSFGYSTAADAGNFYTIMSIPQAGQTGFRVFSNPRVTVCGGLPCGVENEEDNARTLEQTAPIIAGFRTAPTGGWWRGDVDGDGRSDLVWRNSTTGADTIWKAANSATSQSMSAVTNLDWVVLGTADFDGDHKADVFWHNTATNANVIWKGGNSGTPQAVSGLAANWSIVGTGDFDGNGKADLLLRNTSTGQNVIWKSANSATPMAVNTAPSQAWTVAGVGDFDNDHRADIYWHNTSSGQNVIWKSANSATPQAVTASGLAWVPVGVGDFDGDFKADILFRNSGTGQNVVWKAGISATPQAVTAANAQWMVAGVGDFDGDAKADILWHNVAAGNNVIWKSAASSTPQAVSTVSDLNWTISG